MCLSYIQRASHLPILRCMCKFIVHSQDLLNLHYTCLQLGIPSPLLWNNHSATARYNLFCYTVCHSLMKWTHIRSLAEVLRLFANPLSYQCRHYSVLSFCPCLCAFVWVCLSLFILCPGGVTAGSTTGTWRPYASPCTCLSASRHVCLLDTVSLLNNQSHSLSLSGFATCFKITCCLSVSGGVSPCLPAHPSIYLCPALALPLVQDQQPFSSVDIPGTGEVQPSPGSRRRHCRWCWWWMPLLLLMMPMLVEQN